MKIESPVAFHEYVRFLLAQVSKARAMAPVPLLMFRKGAGRNAHDGTLETASVHVADNKLVL